MKYRIKHEIKLIFMRCMRIRLFAFLGGKMLFLFPGVKARLKMLVDEHFAQLEDLSMQAKSIYEKLLAQVKTESIE